MRKFFRTLLLGAAMLGTGMGVSHAQEATPALEVKETIVGQRLLPFSGGTKSRKSGLKALNANLKRKAKIKMQRKSRQINRN